MGRFFFFMPRIWARIGDRGFAVDRCRAARRDDQASGARHRGRDVRRKINKLILAGEVREVRQRGLPAAFYAVADEPTS